MKTGTGTKHTAIEKEVNGIRYVEGVNVGYTIKVKNGGIVLPNVSFRSLRSVKQQLVANGIKPKDIKKTRNERKRNTQQ